MSKLCRIRIRFFWKVVSGSGFFGRSCPDPVIFKGRIRFRVKSNRIRNPGFPKIYTQKKSFKVLSCYFISNTFIRRKKHLLILHMESLVANASNKIKSQLPNCSLIQQILHSIKLPFLVISNQLIHYEQHSHQYKFLIPFL